MANKSRSDIRRGIHSRIRKKVRGTEARPRLAVFRSIGHIYAQVIDDDSGKTLASASSVEKSLKVKAGGNVEGAATIGKAIAERALSAGISEVVYDRGGYIYHGRVKALLDATRKAGLNKNEGFEEKTSAAGDDKPSKSEKARAAAEKKKAKEQKMEAKREGPDNKSAPKKKDAKDSKAKGGKKAAPKKKGK